MVLMNSGQALVVQNKHGQNEPEHPRIAEEPVLFWPLMLRLISLQRSCSLRERDLCLLYTSIPQKPAEVLNAVACDSGVFLYITRAGSGIGVDCAAIIRLLTGVTKDVIGDSISNQGYLSLIHIWLASCTR